MDDQAGVLLIRKTLLERAGYVVLSAPNGEEALRIFRSNQIDVVVSDHLLPGTIGTEMARQMKLAKPGIPILLLSRVVDPPGTEHTDQFIDTTDGPEKLLEAIAAALTSNESLIAKDSPSIAGDRLSTTPSEWDKRTAMMVHEIKNPMDSLLNLLYLANAEPGLTQQGHHYLDMAREEMGRISVIAHSMLHELADDEKPEDTNVSQLLFSVIAFYQPMLEARGISVVTRSRDVGKVAVYAGRLRQGLSNLLLNAADAMPKGGRLRAWASEGREWSGEHRRGVRVIVADNGCGIPVGNLQKILDPFFTTKGSAGSGLGLSLVKDVVEKHGGSLRVRSSTKPGQTGSLFSIFLPRA